MIYATVVSVIYCINFNFKYFCRIMFIQVENIIKIMIMIMSMIMLFILFFNENNFSR